MNKIFTLWLSLALLGCTQHITVDIATKTSQASDLKEKLELEASPPLTPIKNTQLKVTTPKAVRSGCGPFVMPELASIPKEPDLMKEDITTSNEIDRLLTDYIHRLQHYNKNERAKIETAYQNYLKGCKR